MLFSFLFIFAKKEETASRNHLNADPITCDVEQSSVELNDANILTCSTSDGVSHQYDLQAYDQPHIFATSNSKTTSNSIFFHGISSSTLFLHIYDLCIFSQSGRIIEIQSGIMYVIFSGENNLQNSGSETSVSTSFAAIQCSNLASIIIQQEPDAISATLTAIGGYDAAGIGTGPATSCKTIHIKSGKIFASGGPHGTGIGGSYGSLRNSGNIEEIVIENAEITATGWRKPSTGETWGTAIGCGSGGNYNTSNVGTIKIKSGRINAFVDGTGSSWGAVIGGGDGLGDLGSGVKQILILGGTIDAHVRNTALGYGAGIGNGDGYHPYSCNIDLIQIIAGTINLTGGYAAAGLGSGRGFSSTSSNIQEIDIDNSNEGLKYLRSYSPLRCIGNGLHAITSQIKTKKMELTYLDQNKTCVFKVPTLPFSKTKIPKLKLVHLRFVLIRCTVWSLYI